PIDERGRARIVRRTAALVDRRAAAAAPRELPAQRFHFRADGACEDHAERVQENHLRLLLYRRRYVFPARLRCEVSQRFDLSTHAYSTKAKPIWSGAVAGLSAR